VNEHVAFVAHRATFELAETEVSEQHWSRRSQQTALIDLTDEGESNT